MIFDRQRPETFQSISFFLSPVPDNKAVTGISVARLKIMAIYVQNSKAKEAERITWFDAQFHFPKPIFVPA